MAETITLREGLPGFPAGTVLTLAADGLYWDASRKVWLSPRHVDENPKLVDRPVERSAPYFFVDDVADVVSTAWQDAPVDLKRREIGNYFESAKAATKAADEVKRTLGGKGDAALAVEAEPETKVTK